MTGETRPLVERLREEAMWLEKRHPQSITSHYLREAADQIEADAARIKALEAKVATLTN